MTRRLFQRLAALGAAQLARLTAIGYLHEMATVKKGMLTPAPEWWKHLRWRSRAFWKNERKSAKATLQDLGTPAEIVWCERRVDGDAWVDFSQRSDGLFFFTEWRFERVQDDPVLGSYTYSEPMADSGLYASLEDAKRDAVAEIAWLTRLKPDA